MKTIKKLLPVIAFALCMLNFIDTTAQKKTYTEKEINEKLSQVTLSMVESARPFYSKGDSYSNFKLKLYGNQTKSSPSKEGENLMKKVYSYLSSNSTDSKILNDTPKEMGEAVIFVYNYDNANKGNDSDIALFGSTTGDFWPKTSDQKRCCFFCFRCHMITIFGENGGDVIVDAVVAAIKVFIESL